MSARIGVFALLLSSLLLAAPATGWADLIYNVKDHPVPPGAQKLSLENIERNIMIAGGLRHWRCEPLGPGQLRATQDSHGLEAVVDIAFTQQAYSITIVSTVGLRQNDGQIHPHYNFWIRNLEKDIEDRLYLAGLDAK